MIKIEIGNIMNSNANIIAHQVNCRGAMGKGIAKQIRELYPKCYDSYKKACNDHNADYLMGKILLCNIDNNRKIANIFGQKSYGRGLQTNYDALREALIKLRNQNTSIAIPFGMSCKNAGGDWNGVVYPMLEEIFGDSGNLTIYKLCK